jgi:hypothetical protein
MLFSKCEAKYVGVKLPLLQTSMLTAASLALSNLQTWKAGRRTTQFPRVHQFDYWKSNQGGKANFFGAVSKWLT